MSFSYKAITKEEANRKRYELLEDGYYDVYIKTSVPKISESGNFMADMNVSVFDNNGKAHQLRDFLIFTEKMMWKVIHFCESAGLEEEYKAEKFTPEMAEDKHARAFIRTQKGSEIPPDKLHGKPPGSCYPDKNVIGDYIMKDTTPINPKKEEPFVDDESIPF